MTSPGLLPGVQTSQKAHILSLFENLLMNMNYVRTRLVLRVQTMIPRGPRGNTQRRRLLDSPPSPSAALWPHSLAVQRRQPRGWGITHPATCTQIRCSSCPGKLMICWELIKTHRKAGENPFKQQSPEFPEQESWQWGHGDGPPEPPARRASCPEARSTVGTPGPASVPRPP